MGHRSVTTEQAGEQMPMPVRWRTQKGYDGGAAGSTRAFLEAARASPKTCTETSYGAMEEMQREKRSDSVRQHFVLSAREIPSSFSFSSFYRFRREPFGIKFLPTISNYLDLPMYLILSYIYIM